MLWECVVLLYFCRYAIEIVSLLMNLPEHSKLKLRSSFVPNEEESACLRYLFLSICSLCMKSQCCMIIVLALENLWRVGVILDKLFATILHVKEKRHQM